MASSVVALASSIPLHLFVLINDDVSAVYRGSLQGFELAPASEFPHQSPKNRLMSPVRRKRRVREHNPVNL